MPPPQTDKILARLHDDGVAFVLVGATAGLGGYESLLGHSETVSLFDRPIRLLTLDGLILAKRAAARPQDEADVLALEALRELRRPGA